MPTTILRMARRPTPVLFLIAACLLVAAAAAFPGSESPPATPAPARPSHLGTGAWGGRGASLAVGEDGSARLELDCASVRVAGSLPVHPDGGFSWKGTLTAEGPGPTRSDAAGKPVDLRGKIEGDAMTLTIQAAGTDAPIGTFYLERGRPGRLRKCS